MSSNCRKGAISADLPGICGRPIVHARVDERHNSRAMRITVIAAVSYLWLTRTAINGGPLYRRWSSLQDLRNKSGVKRVTSHARIELVYLQMYFGYRDRGSARILGEHAVRADVSTSGTAKYRLIEYTGVSGGGLFLAFTFTYPTHISLLNCLLLLSWKYYSRS